MTTRVCSFGRPQDKFGSVLDAPPLAEEIAQDPVLRNLKLAAAVANPALLPRSGERGFPHWGIWMEVGGGPWTG